MKMSRDYRGAVTAIAVLLLSGCASVSAQSDGAPAPPPAPSSAPPPAVAIAPPAAPQTTPIRPAEQWLFGSAEAAVMIRQTYESMARYATSAAKTRDEDRAKRQSVVLAAGATLQNPQFTACGTKPAAVVFDADETLIWNLGQARWAAERGAHFDPKVWDEWERTGEGKVLAMPGVVDALKALRAANITVVANTNREARNAVQTAATLKAAGLGDFVHGDTLFLKGDDATGSAKDARRSKIAERYCVVAMVGDQLGDFAQGFNDKTLTPAARRDLASAAPTRHLWGKGWFLLPNPTYGPWDRISYDDAFPAATQWEPQP